MQAIIGTDKNNPFFTLYRNEDTKTLHLFFGAALLETIEDKPDNDNFKLLLARLFNSGVKKQSLVDTFKISFNTLKRWGDALKTGDAQQIAHALSGQGAPKKITEEMRAFITHRFKSIYPENKYSYSKEIRAEILEVFNKSLSSESLRPIFNELKEKYFSQKKK